MSVISPPPRLAGFRATFFLVDVTATRRAHEMLNRVTVAFFKRELLNDRSASVEAALHDYHEAFLRRQSPPAKFGQ